jgi:dienelactone hydrolase
MIFRASFLLFVLAVISCGEQSKNAVPLQDTIPPPGDTVSYQPIPGDTTLDISGVEVDILVPRVHKADLLVLPGWSFSRKKWCEESSLCKKALDKGYRLVLPEMGKSVYATHCFPGTRKDWLKYPTLTWVTDTLIPQLQKEYGMFLKGKKNFIVGLSTGGRGVVLVAVKKPVFTAAAALSGDYDQTQMKNDNLMKGVYGEYSQNIERWKTIDNPSQQIEKIDCPLYLGHGMNDKVVPPSQTISYYNKLHSLKPQLKVVLHTPANAGHDFLYWNSEVDAVLEFFGSAM